MLLGDHLKIRKWTLLVVQWIRIHLPMQGIWVPSLVLKDSTCHGATNLMHNYWAHSRACELQLLSLHVATTEPTCRNYWTHILQPLLPTYLEPMLQNKRSTTMRSLHTNEEWLPLTVTRESPCKASKTQPSQK